MIHEDEAGVYGALDRGNATPQVLLRQHFPRTCVPPQMTTSRLFKSRGICIVAGGQAELQSTSLRT